MSFEKAIDVLKEMMTDRGYNNFEPSKISYYFYIVGSKERNIKYN